MKKRGRGTLRFDKKGEGKVLGRKKMRKRSNSLQDDILKIQQSVKTIKANNLIRNNINPELHEMKIKMLSKMDYTEIDGIAIFSKELDDQDGLSQ